MSRKRRLKKQEKRHEDRCAQVADLCRRGAHEEALALAAREWKDPAASPAAGPWAEAADAALAAALRRADGPRLQRLLPLVRSASSPRPLAAVAAAVLDLQAGRLESACSRLDGIEVGSAAGELPRELLAGLGELAREEPAAPGAGMPASLAALWHALRELEAAGYEASAAELESLAGRVEGVRSGSADAAVDAEVRSLLDLCRRHLALAADLAALEAELPAEPAREPPSRSLLGWLRDGRDRVPRLAAALEGAGPPLAEPLRHAAYRRWRALLERVAAAEGGSGLAALAARDPRLLAGELRNADGSPADPGTLGERLRFRRLLEGGRFEELRRLFRKRSRLEADGGELAALWGLELRSFDLEEQAEEEADEGWPAPVAGPHTALMRLGEMAGEIGRRFAPEERLGVAQALRDELFRLLERLHFCDHFGAGARSLLEHADGDPGLLLIAAAAAVTGRDRAARQELEERLTRQRPLRAADRDLAVRIMGQLALEEPRDVAEVLRLVQPLFGDEVWPPVRDRMARELVGMVAGGLGAATDAADFSEEEADAVLRRVQADLEALRPALGAARDFAAAELALRCWTAAPGTAKEAIDAYLAAWPGWEAALLPAKALEEGLEFGDARAGVTAALLRLGNATVDRLDDRWLLWLPEVASVAVAADAGHQRKLLATLKRLRKSPDLSPEDRELLGEAVQALQDARNLLKVMEAARRLAAEDSSPGGRPGGGADQGSRGGRPRKRRRPTEPDPQLDLGFFD